MIKPVLYMQTDPAYRNQNYSTVGEVTTIGKEGCGVCAAAMVIATLKDNTVNPITTANWSMQHGYKALRQGTYYGYFVPQLAAYGIGCTQINDYNTYKNPKSSAHKTALEELKKGNWIIACMGPGRWTSSGHYVLAYGYEDGYVYINDSYNTKSECIKAKLSDWQNEVKYYWIVNASASNTPSIGYKVWVKGKKWLSKVFDTLDYAGIQGTPIRCVKLYNVKNIGRVKYRVHFSDTNKWGKWKIGDGIGIYAGGSKHTIDAIEVFLLDSNKYTIEYRTSTINNSFSGWKRNGATSGLNGKNIDRLQLRVVEKKK